MKRIRFIIILIVLASCKESLTESRINNDTILFTAIFSPPFEEPCKIIIESKDTVKRASLLIFYNLRDYNEAIKEKVPWDTFYYKSINLKDTQLNQLNKNVFTKLQKGIKKDSSSGFDGISIDYELNYNNHKVTYNFWSPDSVNNPEALRLTLNLLGITNDLFVDSVIINYHDDLKYYLDERKFENKKNQNRPIDRLRTKIRLKTLGFSQGINKKIKLLN